MARFCIALLALALLAQQQADPNFKPKIPKPTYGEDGPVVMIDEAHQNFHTAAGRYKPFADLLRADGYKVIAGKGKFAEGALGDARILVIANAGTTSGAGDSVPPAFTDEECDYIREWVRRGGALLLIADHAPLGSANEILSQRFGVQMGKGYVFDVNNSPQDRGPSVLLFTHGNSLLGQHPITKSVNRVMSFTGQSLSVPRGATILLKLSASAWEAPTRETAGAAIEAVNAGKRPDVPSAAGRAQAIALRAGRGRVVIAGEAAMFTAQVIGPKGEGKMGMNVEGNDNQQFALGILHWLSGLTN